MNMTAHTAMAAMGMLVAGVAAAQPVEQFAVGPVVAARGTTASGTLTIEPRADQGTVIPITIVHGAAPGPVLALIAGVHGSEYSPILALQQVRPRLDPR